MHTRASEIWSLGATVYTMMTGIPVPRHLDYTRNISRMNDKGFSESIREVVGAMLEEDSNDRPNAFQLIDKVDEGFERWRATVKEGMEYIDVEDKKWAAKLGIKSV